MQCTLAVDSSWSFECALLTEVTDASQGSLPGTNLGALRRQPDQNKRPDRTYDHASGPHLSHEPPTEIASTLFNEQRPNLDDEGVGVSVNVSASVDGSTHPCVDLRTLFTEAYAILEVESSYPVSASTSTDESAGGDPDGQSINSSENNSDGDSDDTSADATSSYTDNSETRGSSDGGDSAKRLGRRRRRGRRREARWTVDSLNLIDRTRARRRVSSHFPTPAPSYLRTVSSVLTSTPAPLTSTTPTTTHTESSSDPADDAVATEGTTPTADTSDAIDTSDATSDSSSSNEFVEGTSLETSEIEDSWDEQDEDIDEDEDEDEDGEEEEGDGDKEDEERSAERAGANTEVTRTERETGQFFKPLLKHKGITGTTFDLPLTTGLTTGVPDMEGINGGYNTGGAFFAEGGFVAAPASEAAYSRLSTPPPASAAVPAPSEEKVEDNWRSRSSILAEENREAARGMMREMEERPTGFTYFQQAEAHMHRQRRQEREDRNEARGKGVVNGCMPFRFACLPKKDSTPPTSRSTSRSWTARWRARSAANTTAGKLDSAMYAKRYSDLTGSDVGIGKLPYARLQNQARLCLGLARWQRLLSGLQIGVCISDNRTSRPAQVAPTFTWTDYTFYISAKDNKLKLQKNTKETRHRSFARRALEAAVAEDAVHISPYASDRNRTRVREGVMEVGADDDDRGSAFAQQTTTNERKEKGYKDRRVKEREKGSLYRPPRPPTPAARRLRDTRGTVAYVLDADNDMEVEPVTLEALEDVGGRSSRSPRHHSHHNHSPRQNYFAEAHRPEKPHRQSYRRPHPRQPSTPHLHSHEHAQQRAHTLEDSHDSSSSPDLHDRTTDAESRSEVASSQPDTHDQHYAPTVTHHQRRHERKHERTDEKNCESDDAPRREGKGSNGRNGESGYDDAGDAPKQRLAEGKTVAGGQLLLPPLGPRQGGRYGRPRGSQRRQSRFPAPAMGSGDDGRWTKNVRRRRKRSSSSKHQRELHPPKDFPVECVYKVQTGRSLREVLSFELADDEAMAAIWSATATEPLIVAGSRVNLDDLFLAIRFLQYYHSHQLFKSEVHTT